MEINNFEVNDSILNTKKKQSKFPFFSFLTFFFASKKGSKPKKEPIKQTNIVDKDSDLEVIESTFNNKQKRKDKKRKFKMPTPLIIVFVLLIFTIFMTWVPHASWWDVTPGVDPSNPIPDLPGFIPPTSGKFGILDFSYAIFYGLVQSLPVIFYLFVLGAFIEIVLSTNSMEAGISSLLKKTKGKELLLIPILFAMFSLFGALFGMQEETLGYFAILVPFMILAGFGSMTSIGVMMLGTTTGIAASITNPFSTQIAIDLINQVDPSLGMNLGDTLLSSVVIWVIFTTLGATIITIFASKKRKQKLENKQSEIEKQAEEWAKQNYAIEHQYKLDKKRIIVLFIFGGAFLTMIAGVLPWETFIPGYSPGVGGPWWLTFSFAGFGDWGFTEFCVVFIIALILVLAIYRKSMSESTRLILNGAKGMLGVALVIAIARSISIVLTYSGLSFAIVSGVAGPAAKLGTIGFMYIMFIVFLIIGILIPSTSGSATLLFPIITGIIVAAFPGKEMTMLIAMVILFSIALGIANMFSPIQAVVMGSLELSGIKYEKAIKPLLQYSGIFTALTIVAIIPIFSIFLK